MRIRRNPARDSANTNKYTRRMTKRSTNMCVYNAERARKNGNSIKMEYEMCVLMTLIKLQFLCTPMCQYNAFASFDGWIDCKTEKKER